MSLVPIFLVTHTDTSPWTFIGKHCMNFKVSLTLMTPFRLWLVTSTPASLVPTLFLEDGPSREDSARGVRFCTISLEIMTLIFALNSQWSTLSRITFLHLILTTSWCQVTFTITSFIATSCSVLKMSVIIFLYACRWNARSCPLKLLPILPCNNSQSGMIQNFSGFLLSIFLLVQLILSLICSR